MSGGVPIWSFRDRVAVVTGAETVGGAQQVEALAAAGATVLACSRDADPSRFDGAAADSAGSVVPVAIDLGREEQVAALAAQVSSERGRLDALIFNDVERESQPLLAVSDGAWNELVGDSLTAGFLCAKHLAPLMFPARYGKIVYVTGRESSVGVAERAHVCATRHALVGLVKDLAIEVAEHQVNVNVVEPSPRATAATGAESTALTHAVLWLSSDASRFVTGSVVTADSPLATAL